MNRRAILLAWVGLVLIGCGEPKTITLDRMHRVGGSGQYYVIGSVVDVGNGILKYREGDTEWSNLRLRDNTGEYTFHFLPSATPRQPVVGDKIKILIRGKMLDKTVGGSPTVQVIEKFEFDQP